ncbi:amidase, partial [Sinomonas atrocyanea]
MSAPQEPTPANLLTEAQRSALSELVGADIARTDEAAVARAYTDFRAAIEELRQSPMFGRLRGAPDPAGTAVAPSLTGAPWTLRIADASELMRQGELSAVELLESVLGRIEETESFARAWAYVDADGARRAARAADRARRAGDAGPLTGIPLGVKDVIDVQGLPTEAGSRALSGHVASRDAGAVARLRANGAVLLGKLTTHEFAFGQGAPPTRNPRDPQRYPGGSSVGSGVAVAVGSVPGALGTDTGGSVRNPAAVNGLVGLKPTRGVVAGTGVLHVSRTLDHIGPLARTVTDCALLLDGLAEEHGLARLGGPVAPRLGASAPPGRVAVDRRMWSSYGVTDDVAGLIEDAIVDLEVLGIDVVELDLSEMDMALPASLAVSLSESAEHHRSLLARRAEDYLPETRIMIETGALISQSDVELGHRIGAYLRQVLSDAFARTGVAALIAPTLPAIAPHSNRMARQLTGPTGEDSLAGALRMLSPANLTGFPALSVPCGTLHGQPVGLHLMGLPFSDALLLRIAQVYEQESAWDSQLPIRDLPAIP